MIDSGWIKKIVSGPMGREKSHYSLIERGRQILMTIKNFEKNHPIFDLDTFHGI